MSSPTRRDRAQKILRSANEELKKLGYAIYPMHAVREDRSVDPFDPIVLPILTRKKYFSKLPDNICLNDEFVNQGPISGRISCKKPNRANKPKSR